MIFFPEDKRWIDYFWSRVIKSDKCWNWIGPRDNYGYGRVKLRGETFMTHRISYSLANKDFNIYSDLTIHHKCRNKTCVRPDHLEAVTRSEHNKEKLKTHCINGHEYTKENTYINPSGSKVCKMCRKENKRRYLEKNR